MTVGLLRRGAELIAGRSKTDLGDTITYARKSKTSLTIASAPRAKIRLDVTQADGATTVVEQDVFYVDVTELTWGVPVRGDRITDTITGEVFEVLPPDTGGSEWEHVYFAKTYRIFVKKVG